MTREEFKIQFNKAGAQDKLGIVNHFLKNNSSSRDYRYLYNEIQSLDLKSQFNDRIVILSSFTFDQIKEFLGIELFRRGNGSNIQIAGYNQYVQEILDKDSQTYKFKPSVIILAVRIEDLFEDFLWKFNKLSAKQLAEQKTNILSKFDSLINTLRESSNTSVVINNFYLTRFYTSGISDSQEVLNQAAWINTINVELNQMIKNYPGVYTFDINQYMSDYGMERIVNLKMWYTASIPFNDQFINQLAHDYARYIHSLHGKKKCLVLDLDNTLWGGIIGEDGIENIGLGKTYPGNVFVEIQKVIKRYADQGVILALNSKNNEADAKEVFDSHPDTVLGWDDFAATRVNWEPKPKNMVELADEINIGLDSMVFVDDSPFETQMVSESFPEIEIIQFGKNPLENLSIILGLECFDSLDLTEEDIQKREQYKAQAKRSRLKKEMSNIEDFYRDLQMKVIFEECGKFSVKRVAQMTQKTNQFNLTTRRYTEAEIQAYCDSDQYHVYTVSVSDKYGDNGLTGAIIIEEIGKYWYIDTLLLSCRIIGRTIETAVLSFLLQQARSDSIDEIVGVYIPTAKNILVKDLYRDHGFVQDEKGWIIGAGDEILSPKWIDHKIS
jgi:FkbH-like protein